MRRLGLKFVLLNCFVWALLLSVASCGGAGGTKWFPSCSLRFLTPNYTSVVDQSTGVTNKVRWWTGFPLKVWINPNTAVTFDPGGLNILSTDMILAAIARWPVATNNGVKFTIVSDQSDADIEITMQQRTTPLGETIATVNQATREVVAAEIIISWWSSMTLQEFRDGMKATAAHEMGHALYISGHSNTSTDLLYFQNPSALDKAISGIDMNTIRTVYCDDYQTRGRTRDTGLTADGPFVIEKTECPAVLN